MNATEFFQACEAHDWYAMNGNLARMERARKEQAALVNEAKHDSIKRAILTAWADYAYDFASARPKPRWEDFVPKVTTFPGTVPTVHPNQMTLNLGELSA